MFIRIWRTRIDPQRAADYDAFAGSTSLSMFSAQPGFVGVIFAGAGADRAVITLWRDRHSVEALRESDSYKRTVAELEATGILAAGSSVEVLEVISPLHIELSEIVRGGLMSDGQEDVRRPEGRDHPFAGQRQTAAALPNRLQSVKSSYDAVAAEYAQRISGELEGKPFDRALLDEIAAGATGLICDLGCGPGHVAHYLHQRGAAVLGIDISPAMIAEARRRYPTLRFETGDIRSLPHEDNTFGAAVAMYSLIHFADRELADALREVHRTLVPGGPFLASFHRGTGAVHHDELFGRPVNLDFRFFEPQQIVVAMTDSDFEIDRLLERDPYPGIEAETTRFYILATASENP